MDANATSVVVIISPWHNIMFLSLSYPTHVLQLCSHNPYWFSLHLFSCETLHSSVGYLNILYTHEFAFTKDNKDCRPILYPFSNVITTICWWIHMPHWIWYLNRLDWGQLNNALHEPSLYEEHSLLCICSILLIHSLIYSSSQSLNQGWAQNQLLGGKVA